MAMTIGLCSAWFAPRNSVSDLLFTVVSKYSHSGIMWSTWRLLDPPPYVFHISVIDYCTSGLCQVHSTALGLAQLVTWLFLSLERCWVFVFVATGSGLLHYSHSSGLSARWLGPQSRLVNWLIPRCVLLIGKAGSRAAANFSSSCHDHPCISISAKLVLNLGKSHG